MLVGKIRTEADIEAVVLAYTELSEQTPLAIEEPWGG